MSYFKYTSKETITAWEEIYAEDAAYRRKGQTFADLFGAKAVFKNDLTHSSFYGIRFNGETYGAPEMWTKPKTDCLYACWPRAKAPKGMSEQHTALKSLWEVQIPIGSIDWTKLYEVLGLDWGMLFLTGLTMFRHGDAIYVQTGARPKAEANATEILGSEFDTARKAADAAQAGAK